LIEVAEKFHIHYRNMRLLLSLDDFVEMSQGFIRGYDRWQKLCCPEAKEGQHIELCRRIVGRNTFNEGVKINLNKNLYPQNEGRIFSEGADFSEDKYIHLKVRDVRIELSIADFRTLADAVKEAEAKLEGSSIGSVL
jgi:hypothetical protein